MRTMKDVERLMIIIRIFLHLHGEATAKEISDYINNCPVFIQTEVSPRKIGSLLREKNRIRSKTEGRAKKYWVEI